MKALWWEHMKLPQYSSRHKTCHSCHFRRTALSTIKKKKREKERELAVLWNTDCTGLTYTGSDNYTTNIRLQSSKNKPSFPRKARPGPTPVLSQPTAAPSLCVDVPQKHLGWCRLGDGLRGSAHYFLCAINTKAIFSTVTMAVSNKLVKAQSHIHKCLI